jgi:hypothetical protein
MKRTEGLTDAGASTLLALSFALGLAVLSAAIIFSVRQITAMLGL